MSYCPGPLAVFCRGEIELFLEVAVEAADCVESAFAGNVENGHFTVLQKIAGFADPVLIYIIVVGDSHVFLEEPGQIGVIVPGMPGQIVQGASF